MQNQLPKGKEHEKTLGLFDLSILGIGAIIGTGILLVYLILGGPSSMLGYLLVSSSHFWPAGH